MRVVISILLTVACLSATKPKQSGFVPYSLSNFRTTQNQIVMAYSDLNHDGEIDIITKSGSGSQTVNAYIWNGRLLQFYLAGSIEVGSLPLKTLLVADFAEKPVLALYLETNDNNLVLKGYITILEVACAINCTFNVHAEPKLLGIDPVEPTLITFRGATLIMYSFSVPMSYCYRDGGYIVQSIPLNVPNLSYRVVYSGDYDGDCLSDLILLSDDSNGNSHLQFSKGSTQGQFQFVGSANLNRKVQYFTLNDINYDGRYDLILLLEKGGIQIHYNRSPPSQQLCTALPPITIPFDFVISPNAVSRIQQIIWAFPTDPSSTLLFGDYDRDGYDDLTLTLNNGQPTAVLYHNAPCINQACGAFNPAFIQTSSTGNLRTFTAVAMPTRAPSLKISFFDVFDDGTLDLIINTLQQDTLGSTLGSTFSSVLAIINNYSYDAFFLKMHVQRSKPNSVSTNAIGTAITFFVTLLSGEQAPKVGTILSQAGRALQLPMMVTGLGRTNNYVNYVTANLPSTQLVQQAWTPIIPNSEIVILLGIDANGEAFGSLNAMIEPTDRLGLVILLVILSLAAIGFAIIRLTKQEKNEDAEHIQSFYAILK